MDFGALTSEIQRGQGSGLLKTQRSGSGQEGWRVAKAPKTEEFSLFSQGQGHRSGPGISGNNGQTMISFSSQSPAHGYGDEDAPKASVFPFFLAPPDPFSPRTSASGYGTDQSSEVLRGAISRFRGPFSPSQWMELEHQALIYKHIMAGVPVPSNLLLPLRKSLNQLAFSSFSSGAYGSNPLGWGSFHLGFSGSTDPEPGRCRRTDGKKWRCSRDAVPDQKYCERHINRGRHRSRKPVEGQNGQAILPGSVIQATAASKAAMSSIASSSIASIISSNSPSNSLGAVQHHFKNNDHHLMNSLQGVPMVVGNGISFKPKDSPFSLQKQQVLFGGSEFGQVSPDSLLNPTQESSSRMNNPKSSDSYLSGFSAEDPPNQDQPLRHFIDNWPKDQSNRRPGSWPEEPRPDWTQLSMSIPVSAADFSSSSNSPRNEINKPTLSPLRLNVNNQKDFWGNSVVGGPLGEVLNSTSVTTEGCGLKNTTAAVSALNLMTEAWHNNSPNLGCSPTGVLQRSTFVSLSNSSSGSSPRTDRRRVLGGAILCDDLLGSSSSIPSL